MEQLTEDLRRGRRAVRKYLADSQIKYKTMKKKPVKPVVLSDEQKQFIHQYSEDRMSSFQIAQVIFPGKDVKNLGVEQRTVHAHTWGHLKDNKGKRVKIASSYSPPKT